MSLSLQKFLKRIESKTAELSSELNIAYFNATVTGKEELYKKVADLEFKLIKIYSSKADFKKLTEYKKSGTTSSPHLNRQVSLLHSLFQEHQFEQNIQKKIISLSNTVERIFTTHRIESRGKTYTDNQVDSILKNSKDIRQLESIWKASKKIGELLEDSIYEIVELRNKGARDLGYKNYFQMQLILNEQDPLKMDQLFDQLDWRTSTPFVKLKDKLDEQISKKLNVNRSDLKPWYYGDRFFQHGPEIVDINLDNFYKNKDLVKITADYFNGIGLDISDLIKNSDLYEKPGKYQHAYCTNINRQGDVRVVANVKPDYRWMGTLLHEFGHAVYDKYINESLPWELRKQAHIFVTESIAMFFGRLASNPFWIKSNLGIPENKTNRIKDDCLMLLKAEQLIFSRWVQVMYRFEKALYEGSSDNYNKLWWELVEKYQNLKIGNDRTKPDWASKIHLALYPVYYNNYLLGELLASQFFAYISKNILDSENLNEESFTGNRKIGEYFKEEVFSHGASYSWNDLIRKATHEELTTKYYVHQFG